MTDKYFDLEAIDCDLEDYLEGTNLRHPLLFATLPDPQRAAVVNNQYRRKCAALDEAISTGDWHSYVFLHERPHRHESFVEVASELADEPYWKLAAEIWQDSENIWQHQASWRAIWNCGRQGKQATMIESERGTLASLPETITIYRGFSGDYIEGMSWTLDRDKAIWFARRFGRIPGLATALAMRADVHAFFDGRNEREIVIDKFKVIRREDISRRDER